MFQLLLQKLHLKGPAEVRRQHLGVHVPKVIEGRDKGDATRHRSPKVCQKLSMLQLLPLDMELAWPHSCHSCLWMTRHVDPKFRPRRPLDTMISSLHKWMLEQIPCVFFYIMATVPKQDGEAFHRSPVTLRSISIPNQLKSDYRMLSQLSHVEPQMSNVQNLFWS